MARFGQSFLSALTQPSYGQGLFELGGAIGGTPADIAKKKAEQEKLEKQRQMARLEAAGAESTDRVQRARDDAIYRRAMQVAEKRKDVNAMQALEVKAIDPREYLSSTVDTGGNVTSSRSAGQYVDEKGHIYEVDIQRTPQGSRRSYIAVSPDAPENPVGKLTRVGGAYGETAAERLGRGIEAASRETKEEEFSKLQVEAAANLPNIEIAIGNAERSLELLKQIKTGGFTTAVVRSAQQVIGTEPQSQAEFNLLAGKTVLDNLSKFPGAISEGERLYLERLYQSLERSGGANQAILENLLQEAQFLLADAEAKANASSYSDYLETRPTFSSVTSKDKGVKKINFGDMTQ